MTVKNKSEMLDSLRNIAQRIKQVNDAARKLRGLNGRPQGTEIEGDFLQTREEESPGFPLPK